MPVGGDVARATLPADAPRGRASMGSTGDAAEMRATPAQPPRPAATSDHRPLSRGLHLPHRPPRPLPRGAGTDSHGPMDPPNTRLTRHG
jgi:hypothetical protein